MKKGIFLTLLVFASQLHGYQYADDSTFVFAEALIWKFRAGSADNWAQEISPAGTDRTARILGVPFKWQPGLRVGVGQNNCDDWDTVFSYTGFQTKGKSQASPTSGSVYSPFLGNFYINNTNGAGISGPIYQSANIQWKVLYNIFDLEIGRKFAVDPFLKLRPFIGLKGGSINQTIHSNWQNPSVATTFTSASENLKNNFWGIGPSIGLDTTWAICQSSYGSFNLFADISGSLLWGHWRFKDQYENNTTASVAVHLRPINGAATMARGLLGIEWTHCLSTESSLTIRLGYEAQVWFNQMQYYSFNMGRLNNLLSLQGGVLNLRFNF